jgi:Transposase DDE domain
MKPKRACQRSGDKKTHQRRRGRAFQPEMARTIEQTLQMIGTLAPELRKWLALNLALLTVAMLQLWRGARSGNGWLTLCALSRTLPLEEREKARSKRLYRLLANKHLEGPEMTPWLVLMALGPQASGWVPIVVDQTDIRGTPTLMAGIRVAHRILPVAFVAFEYLKIRKSQNLIENTLLKLVAMSLPRDCKPLFTMDRGYARVSLLEELDGLRIPYLIRGRAKTMVRIGGRRISLGRLPHRRRRPSRYVNVLYQDEQQHPVDVVAFHDPEFKQPWFLLLPPNSAESFPTDQALALYRERMHIELTFRDWKTHLGIRGLRLEADVAARLNRLLLALTAAYILAVLIGASETGIRVRNDCEVLRSTPRHGTRCRLSALSVGILLLSLPRFAALAEQALASVLLNIRRGRPLAGVVPIPR